MIIKSPITCTSRRKLDGILQRQKRLVLGRRHGVAGFLIHAINLRRGPEGEVTGTGYFYMEPFNYVRLRTANPTVKMEIINE